MLAVFHYNKLNCKELTFHVQFCGFGGVFLQDKFLEVAFLGQRLYAFLILTDTAKWLSKELYQFALLPRVYERAHFIAQNLKVLNQTQA